MSNRTSFWTIVWAVVLGLLIHDFINNPRLPNNPWTPMTWVVIICSVIIVAGLLIIGLIMSEELEEAQRLRYEEHFRANNIPSRKLARKPYKEKK